MTNNPEYLNTESIINLSELYRELGVLGYEKKEYEIAYVVKNQDGQPAVETADFGLLRLGLGFQRPRHQSQHPV